MLQRNKKFELELKRTSKSRQPQKANYRNKSKVNKEKQIEKLNLKLINEQYLDFIKTPND